MSAFSVVIGGLAELAKVLQNRRAPDPSRTLAGYSIRLSPYAKYNVENALSAALGEAMRRREFVTLLGGAAAAWSLGARAQQGTKTIGFMGAHMRSPSDPLVIAFVERLRELGWVESRNISIEFRWWDGNTNSLPEIIADFVRLNVDVMVLEGSAATLAAKRATSVIPIVFPVSADPISAGLVASLARPGGNVTGLSMRLTDVAGKRLQLLREVIPDLKRLAIMVDLSTPAIAQVGEAQEAARMLGLDIVTTEIRQAEDIEPAFAALKGRAEGLYVCSGPLFDTHRVRISTLALSLHLPSSYEVRQFVTAGGLMSYGPDFADQFRHAADLVDKILRGIKPADIPVEQPTKLYLVINLKTAKTLGITVPPILLATADDVIE